MANELVKHTSDASLVATLIINGDLSKLNQAQKVEYYNGYCNRLGLDPFTKPFEVLKLGDKEVLYCTRSGTQQLNKLHQVSHTITAREVVSGCYVVTAQASTPDGRKTESIGAVPITKEGGEWQQAQNGKRYFKGNGTVIEIKGEDLCNAMMKAETKAKRRATLDLLGLGVLDESEVDSIAGAKKDTIDASVEVVDSKINESTKEDEVMQQWKDAVNACNTIAEIKALYIKNKQVVDDNATINALFAERKKQINKSQTA